MNVTIAWVLVGLIASGVAIYVVNQSHLRWFYHPSRPKVANLLSRSLERKANNRELDCFLSVPILNDPLLERVRQEFGSLYGPTSFETTNATHLQPPWKPGPRERIEAMIDSLKQAGANG
jgi:hypothetical protein